PAGKMGRQRDGVRPPSMRGMRWKDSTDAWSLKQQAFAFDHFLDFFLPEPGFDIVLKINQFEVHLVEDRLDTLRFIQDRGDIPLQHIVSADLLPRSFLRVLERMDVLFATFLADLFSFSLASHEGH